jgi:hypothetical protein
VDDGLSILKVLTLVDISGWILVYFVSLRDVKSTVVVSHWQPNRQDPLWLSMDDGDCVVWGFAAALGREVTMMR